MRQTHLDYVLEDSLDRLDLSRIHSWLTTSYWSPGIPRDVVERAARGSSMVVGAYLVNEQVGYLRVVSDGATFAWIADVFVHDQHRSRGLAKAMVTFALDHPDHRGLRRWLLATRDAHPIYAECGFVPLPYPERFMIHKPPPGLSSGGWTGATD